jgi:hypothetical protein
MRFKIHWGWQKWGKRRFAGTWGDFDSAGFRDGGLREVFEDRQGDLGSPGLGQIENSSLGPTKGLFLHLKAWKKLPPDGSGGGSLVPASERFCSHFDQPPQGCLSSNYPRPIARSHRVSDLRELPSLFFVILSISRWRFESPGQYGPL